MSEFFSYNHKTLQNLMKHSPYQLLKKEKKTKNKDNLYLTTCSKSKIKTLKIEGISSVPVT